MKKITLATMAIAIMAASCGSNNSSNNPQNADTAKAAAAQEPAAKEDVSPTKKKQTNWEKPLCTINEKGDSIEVWRYNDKGLLVYYKYENGSQPSIREYSYSGSTKTETWEDQKYIHVYADDSFAKETECNGKKFEFDSNGKIVKGYDIYGFCNNYEYNDDGSIKQICTEIEEGYSDCDCYSYSNGITRIENEGIIMEKDSQGRLISETEKGIEGSETKYQYSGNIRTASVTDLGQAEDGSQIAVGQRTYKTYYMEE